MSDLIVMMRSASETVGKLSGVLTKYKNITFVEALGNSLGGDEKRSGKGFTGLVW